MAVLYQVETPPTIICQINIEIRIFIINVKTNMECETIIIVKIPTYYIMALNLSSLFTE